MSAKIVQLTGDFAENLCRNITLDLPEYFGLPDCNEHYAKGVRENTNFAIQVADEYIGLISLNFPYPQSANIYWMALFKKYHGQGFYSKFLLSMHLFGS